MHDFGIIMINY